jgi:2-polyprenyl-3-methyl-5-hydroxy-6-metoxy-1,4-benzoquinol methylase
MATSAPDHGSAAARWSAALGEWAIPAQILESTDRSPWGHPVKRFAARADADLADPGGSSYRQALAALAEVRGLSGRPGTLLDVGSGAGAASLPLAPWTRAITAVDPSAEMLAAFTERAGALPDAPAVTTVEGRWPQVADHVHQHDVVVSHHVVYDVPDIGPFVAALTAKARGRVVVEIVPQHPMSWINPLWMRFHGLARPTRPTADDFVAVLHEAGVRALLVERWTRAEADGLTRDELVGLATRRLCLPADREPEVAAALDDLQRPTVRPVVTLSWAGAAAAR